tara:strand:- start:83 stop:502 length:420 start_codon:yes stop_codon:yes gene_type:complete
MPSESEKAKNYSLAELEVWISDSMESGATPEEIYDTIVSVVKKNVRFHKACYRDGKELFELLSNRPYLDTVSDDTVAETREQLSMMWDDESSIDMSKFKLDSAALHDVEDKPSYQQMIDAGYIMSDDGFWLPKPNSEDS